MAEFRHCLLKKPHEGDGGDNSGLTSSKEPKISLVPGSFTPKAPLPKKHKERKEAKAKVVIRLDFEVPITSEAKSKLNILAKIFYILSLWIRSWWLQPILNKYGGIKMT